MATAWLVTPGKTHLFFIGSEDKSWYLQHFCLWCQGFYLKFAWQARDGTAFFLFRRCFSMYFEGHRFLLPTCQADSRVGTHSCV